MLDRRAMLGAAVGLPSALAWPRSARAADGRRMITAMMTDDPATLCYPLFNTRLTQEICGNINESLLLFDWQFRPQPNLAKSFEMSPDGLTYVFRLRDDVVWHDGKPFTAHDVAFSCGQMLPQLNPRSRAAFSHIASIKTPDRHTVEMRLSQPFSAFLLSFMASSAPMMPAHIYEGTDFRTNPYNLKPIGTGPFKFKEWVSGDHQTLVRNDDYWNKSAGGPYVDEVIIKILPEPTTRVAGLDTGEIDYLVNNVPSDQYATVEAMENVTLTFAPSYYGEWITFNTAQAPFDNVQLRQALNYAVDKAGLRALYYGAETPATKATLVYPSRDGWAARPSLEVELDESGRVSSVNEAFARDRDGGGIRAQTQVGAEDVALRSALLKHARELLGELHRDDGIVHVTLRFGYAETPDVPRALALLDAEHRRDVRPGDVGRDRQLTRIATRRGGGNSPAPFSFRE